MVALPRLFIRADADPSVGSGHVMRCLAIAQSWIARGGAAALLYRSCPQQLLQRHAAEGVVLQRLQRDDEAEWRQMAEGRPDALLLVDGYHFSPAYRSRLQAVFSHTVLLDDYATELPAYADCVINPQPWIREGHYATSGVQRVLLGLDYMPLRREFGRDDQQSLPLEERRRVLLTMGGTDPACLSLPLSRLLLEQLPGAVTLDVVTASSHPDAEALDGLAVASAGRLRLWHDVEDMAGLMATTGLAITAAGSTVWELAAMRVPAVVVMVAENQRVIGEYPYWAAVLDAMSGGLQPVAGAVARQAVQLWSDTARRQRIVENLHALSLGQGSNHICDCLAALVTPEEGDGQL